MNLTKRIISIGIFCCFLQSTFAQLVSEQVSSKLATQYSKYDTIYTFNAGILPSSIRFSATAPDSVNSTFEWSRFDTTAKVFNTAHTENGIITSSYTLPNTGGYRVHIFNGSGLDTTFTFWTFIDSLSVTIDKNTDGTVCNFCYTCDYIDLKVLSTKWNPFTYYNPATKEAIVFQNKVKSYAWTADPEAFIPKPKANGSVRVYEHPESDTWYTVTVTDSLGGSSSDEVKFIAIKPKAQFTPAFGNDKKSSPLKVWLNNESSDNAAKFTWYTQLPFPELDTIYTREPMDSLVYLEPGKYVITLIAESSWHCVDSVSDSIEVALPNLSIPNFFTPGNNDGSNDFFILDKAISVVNFKITIFSRNGKKVYEDSGESLMNWEGWNGKMNGNGEDASPGVYYYVLEVKTYEKRPTIPWVYKGFVYLFRKGE